MSLNVTKGKVIRTRSILPKLAFEELLDLNEMAEAVGQTVLVYFGPIEGGVLAPAYLVISSYEEVDMADREWLGKHLAFSKTDAMSILLRNRT